MKRKLSKIEVALLIVPLLALAALTAREPLRLWWDRTVVGGVPYDGDWGDFAWSPDSRHVVLSSWNSKSGFTQLQWIDVRTGNVVAHFQDVGAGFIEWAPDGKHFALTGSNSCAIWDATTHQKLFKTQIATASYLSYKWKSNDVLEMVDSQARQISPRGVVPIKYAHTVTTYQLDIRTQAVKNLGTAPRSSTRLREDASRLSPDGLWKVTLSDSRTSAKAPKTAGFGSFQQGQRVQLWNRKTGQLVRTYEGDMFSSVAFLDRDTIVGVASLRSTGGVPVGEIAPPSTYVCTMKMDKNSSLWQPLAGGEYAFEFSPSARFLASKTMENVVLRDTRTWRILSEMPIKNLRNIEFSPDESWVAAITSEKTGGRLKLFPASAQNSS